MALFRSLCSRAPRHVHVTLCPHADKNDSERGGKAMATLATRGMRHHDLIASAQLVILHMLLEEKDTSAQLTQAEHAGTCRNKALLAPGTTTSSTLCGSILTGAGNRLAAPLARPTLAKHRPSQARAPKWLRTIGARHPCGGGPAGQSLATRAAPAQPAPA